MYIRITPRKDGDLFNLYGLKITSSKKEEEYEIKYTDKDAYVKTKSIIESMDVVRKLREEGGEVAKIVKYSEVAILCDDGTLLAVTDNYCLTPIAPAKVASDTKVEHLITPSTIMALAIEYMGQVAVIKQQVSVRKKALKEMDTSKRSFDEAVIDLGALELKNNAKIQALEMVIRDLEQIAKHEPFTSTIIP